MHEILAGDDLKKMNYLSLGQIFVNYMIPEEKYFCSSCHILRQEAKTGNLDKYFLSEKSEF
jgi:hypothetical protein